MPDTVVRFENVKKSFGEVQALGGVTLDVAAGEFLTVVGSSGGGKTTLLKMVNGLFSPDEGRVEALGQDVASCDIIALRRRIGYVIQGAALFGHLTVRQNICFVPGLCGRSLPEERLRELLRLVDLDESVLCRRPGELSGGQQQRVGIARALAESPALMLMDEPFGAVDEITRTTLQDNIAEIHRELSTTILFVTHDIREAMKLGSRVLVMNGGQVEQAGTPQELRSAPASEYVRKLLGEQANGQWTT